MTLSSASNTRTPASCAACTDSLAPKNLAPVLSPTTILRSVSVSVTMLAGFCTKAITPSASAATCVSSCPKPVSKTTFERSVPVSRASARMASTPLSPGSVLSSKVRSNFCGSASRISAVAASADATAVTCSESRVSCSTSTARASSWSSTSKTRSPASSVGGTNGAASCCASNHAVKLKRLPSSGVLWTPIVPPMRAVSCLQIARPSPVPP